MNNTEETFGIVSSNTEWKLGYIVSEDTSCEVVCICGESLWVGTRLVKCNCGRFYWNEFRTYRLETEDQRYETVKMELKIKYD